MSGYMILGIVVGFIVGIVIVAAIYKIAGRGTVGKCEFDERQEIVRGRGFKRGFIALIIYNAVYGLAAMTTDRFFMDPLAAIVLGIILAVGVYIVYCIWNDAYFSLNENPRRMLVLFVAVTVLNMIVTVVNILNDELIVDGVLTFRSTNLFCGILFIVIFITFFAKQIVRRREEG